MFKLRPLLKYQVINGFIQWQWQWHSFMAVMRNYRYFAVALAAVISVFLLLLRDFCARERYTARSYTHTGPVRSRGIGLQFCECRVGIHLAFMLRQTKLFSIITSHILV